jgi:hypothetical protein
MAKNLLIFFLALLPVCSFAQGNNGLIAHWNFNNNTNDASGHGHNGSGVNISSAPGKNGTANTAWYFNGTSSYISVPYDPTLNLTQYSICAEVKIQHFYSGLCQGNIILSRGAPTHQGNYTLWFHDNAFDNDNCAALDTTHESFTATAGSNVPPTPSYWQYSPTIQANTWACVVATYDSANFKIYVDGTLMVTVPGASVPTGTSLDSLIIGMDLWDAPNYPYNFQGWIDDIKLYNRPLSALEVSTYCATVDLDVPQEAKVENITLYPNPANDIITVQLPADMKAVIFLTDAMGKVINRQDIATAKSTFNIQSLPSGVYFIKVVTPGGATAVKQFVK